MSGHVRVSERAFLVDGLLVRCSESNGEWYVVRPYSIAAALAGDVRGSILSAHRSKRAAVARARERSARRARSV